MTKQVIIDNEFLSMWYYPEDKIIHHKFHQFMYGDHFRDGLMKGAEAMEKYKANKWLSDDRDNSAITPEDKEWGDTIWFDRVKAAGWEHWAIVLPLKIVGQMNMKRIIQSFSDKGINCRIFSDPDEAMVWLKAQ